MRKFVTSSRATKALQRRSSDRYKGGRSTRFKKRSEKENRGTRRIGPILSPHADARLVPDCTVLVPVHDLGLGRFRFPDLPKLCRQCAASAQTVRRTFRERLTFKLSSAAPVTTVHPSGLIELPKILLSCAPVTSCTWLSEGYDQSVQ